MFKGLFQKKTFRKPLWRLGEGERPLQMVNLVEFLSIFGPEGWADPVQTEDGVTVKVTVVVDGNRLKGYLVVNDKTTWDLDEPIYMLGIECTSRFLPAEMYATLIHYHLAQRAGALRRAIETAEAVQGEV